VLAIPTTSVPTSGAVFDLSKWDEATWGDAESDQAIERLGIGNSKHAPDALIAATAAGLVDWLVTEDRPLTNRVRRAGLPVEVTDYAGLVKLISRI
jgi:rRNA-processing protein FCF1